MLKLDDRIDRLATHVCDRVLVAEPVGTSHRIEHVPAPFVVFDISQSGADATLRGDGVASCGKHLGDTGRVQTGRDHPERRPESGAAGTEDNHVERVVNDFVRVGHSGLPIGRERA